MILAFMEHIRYRNILIAEFEARNPQWSLDTLEMLASAKLRNLLAEVSTREQLEMKLRDFLLDKNMPLKS